MRRREFLGVLGGALAWPFAAHGQQALRRAGLLLPGTPASHGAYASTFTRGVEQGGLNKDRDFALDVVYAEGRLDRIPALIADLVGRNVDVLAAGSTGAGIAAKQATSTIPVVFVSGDDPVSVGLVQSVNRPGGNVTGVSLFATELIQKRVGLLLELSPAATVMGFLANPANPNAEPDIKRVLATADQRGQQAVVVNASRDDEIDVAFATFAEKRATTLLSHSDPFLNSRRGRIIDSHATA